jgi:glycosyltransferase involved in cell wall biosynthesis
MTAELQGSRCRTPVVDTSTLDAVRSCAMHDATVVASFPPVIRANPYQRLLYEHLQDVGVVLYGGRAEFTIRWLWRVRRGVQAIHFHWPQGYYRCRRAPARMRPSMSWLKLSLFGMRLVVARTLGYRVIWTVHQVLPHEVSGVRLERAGSRVLASFSDVLIAHDEATAATVLRELRQDSAKLRVIPHGSYVDVYPEGRSREAVRAELAIPTSAFVFLSFGNIRAYKDLELVVRAFSDAAPREAVLVVAGAPMNEAASEAITSAAERDRRIKPRLGYVPNERVAELFGAADALIVGRGDGGTSGALILGMSLGLPTIASDNPAYRELLGDGAAGWLYRAADGASLGKTLARAAADPTARTKGDDALRRASELDWDTIAERTAQALRSD